MNPQHLGIDLGFGANKLYGPHGGLELPSQVAIANGRVVTRLHGMKSKRPPMRVTVGARSYYVGLGAHDWGKPVESLDYERLTNSPEILAIFYGAMTEYLAAFGELQQPIKLIVGLPLETLTGAKETVRATVQAVRGWMVANHRWRTNGELYGLDVAEVTITAQPTGALFDYLLDDEGQYIKGRKAQIKKEIGIISVGFNTVELLAMSNLAPVNRFTSGSKAGVRRLLELVEDGQHYSLGELDALLRANNLDVKNELPIWAREVNGTIERTWGTAWKRFAQVVTVGGGAILLNGNLTTRFEGKVTMPDQPVLSIARGLYKMGLRK